MNAIQKILGLGFVGALSFGASVARADLEVGVSFRINAASDFYAALSPRGTWVEVGTYGRCWRPARVETGWRPYCSGEWVWTDCGWYWQSEEPWAWACYHYGYWVYDPDYGWIWIPGVEWAPAWVTWRCGGGYIGWAPLAPVHVSVEPQFVFVSTGRFQSPIHPSTVVIQNNTLITKTTVIKNVRRETRTIEGVGAREVVVNDGPEVETVRQATGHKLKPVSIRQVASRANVPTELRNRSQETPRQNKISPTPAPSTRAPIAPEGKATVPQVEKPAKPDQRVEPRGHDNFKSGRSSEREPKFTPYEPNQARPEQRSVPKESPVAPERRLPPGQSRSGKGESAAPAGPSVNSRPRQSPPPSPGKSDKEKEKPDAGSDEGRGHRNP
ncbi:MAG: hypothetical protein EPO07_00420 [Verrucomicrobia bacterium]|nr:MAG: hypothetical protein EPO07_00420 [Verrucomicrobiota bacterium]